MVTVMVHYGCLYCDETFESKQQRDNHIRVHHTDDS
jgi:DNA-directed RNA polymerase subunit RPC12/RpoP